MFLKDVHSWVGGHAHNSEWNADYGDILSFYKHLKADCDRNKRDLWFVNNGDFMHGTGLAMEGNATELIGVLKQMPFDAMTLGNHEAYESAVVKQMNNTLIPDMQDRYLTSNTLLTETWKPLGSRYKLLKGRNTVLVFGFMYNLHDPSQLLTVEHVEDVVQQEWFTQALEEETFDAIMVLAHMDVEDPLVKVILTAIRSKLGKDMPVQFITGHTHVKAEVKVDLFSHSMEAGFNLETLGFVSFPTQTTAQALEKKKDAHALFRHEFLEANIGALSKAAGVEKLRTDAGKALSKYIKDLQQSLALLTIEGCPPRDYYRNRTMFQGDSIWKLYMEEVIPKQFTKGDPSKIVMVSSNSFRYDVKGSDNGMTLDDVVAIVPFHEPMVYIGEVPVWTLRKMNSSLNTLSMHSMLPEWMLIGDLEALGTTNQENYKLYTTGYNQHTIVSELKRLYVHESTLKQKKTGDYDTMIWLSYVQQHWKCTSQKQSGIRPENMVPWWIRNPGTLDEEKTDGGMSSDSEDEEDKLDDEIEENQAANAANANANNAAKGKPPSKTQSNYGHAGNKNYVGEKKQNFKAFKKIFLSVLAIGFLAIPILGVGYTIYSRIGPGSDQEETFYDPEELATLKKRSKHGAVRRPQRRRQQQHRPLPREIEITESI
jgi:2',3'-cyclic-nucleotide 2'-phosphodiesterase (5'-nucleotidase family)